MRHLSVHNRFILVTGIIFILLGWVMQFAGTEWIIRQRANTSIEQAQENIFKKEKYILGLFKKLQQEPPNKLINSFDEIIREAEENQVLFYIYQGKELLLWTNNRVFPSLEHIGGAKLRTIELDNGLYLQASEKRDDIVFAALIPVQSFYPYQNEYLQNKLLLNIEHKEYLRLSTSQTEASPIYTSDGNFLFSLKIINRLPEKQWPIWIYLTGVLFLFLWVQKQISYFFMTGRRWAGWALFLLAFTLAIIDWKVFKFPHFLFNEPVFSAQFYASSTLLPSLGDLFIFILLLTWLISFISAHVELLSPRNKKWLTITTAIVVYASLNFGQFIVRLFQGLIINSNIHLSIKDFFSLSFLSFVVFILLFLLLLNLARVTYWFFMSVKPIFQYRWLSIIAFSTGVILYFIGDYLMGSIDYLVPVYMIVLWLGFIFREKNKPLQFNFLIFLFFLGAAFGAKYLVHFNQQKEKQYRKHVATRITSERDAVTEYLFSDLTDRITNDRYIKNFFIQPWLSQNFLKQRIQELYFTGYLNKYDIKVYTYGLGDLPYKGNFGLPLEVFRRQILNHGQEVIHDHLYFLNQPGRIPSYLASFDFKHLDRTIGTVVVELQKKTFYEESIYPALLLEQHVGQQDLVREYSYAIYNRNKLVSQKGDYPYPVISYLKNVTPHFLFFDEDGYSHLYYRVNEETFVMVSKPKDPRIYPLAVFSFLFFIFFILGMTVVWGLPFLANLKIKPKRLGRHLINPGITLKNVLFQRKIQFVILLSVFVGLGIFGLSTFSYLRYKYNEQKQDEIKEKIKLISGRLEQEIEKEPRMIYERSNQKLFARITNLADLYQLDINIFDLNGRLISSSQPQIFSRDIIAPVMNAKAFNTLRIQQRSQLVQNEEIGNLEYLSVYSPIRNESNQILAFLQLPYFAKETELQNEISSLLVTLLNLYMLIFLAVSIFSFLISKTLTSPLELIRDKMRAIQLGRNNEPISYRSNDEIGQLIKEYNFMISELEKSADALAQSEREGAWREMARQVAHEIKNPLTPMKLNIQQLQRSWHQGAPNLEQNFKRVTNILITQIDQLSQIASEFSAFAKMPAGKPEKIEVEETLESVVSLYQDSSDAHIRLVKKAQGAQVFLDEGHLSRIFNNLIKNAIQSLEVEQEGEIVAETSIDHRYIRISIKDNGSGIPEDKRDKIFQPNFSTKSSGMGLGLAIVKKMVESANGKIWFESDVNKGTTFFLSFPLVKA